MVHGEGSGDRRGETSVSSCDCPGKKKQSPDLLCSGEFERGLEQEKTEAWQDTVLGDGRWQIKESQTQ